MKWDFTLFRTSCSVVQEPHTLAKCADRLDKMEPPYCISLFSFSLCLNQSQYNAFSASSFRLFNALFLVDPFSQSLSTLYADLEMILITTNQLNQFDAEYTMMSVCCQDLWIVSGYLSQPSRPMTNSNPAHHRGRMVNSQNSSCYPSQSVQLRGSESAWPFTYYLYSPATWPHGSQFRQHYIVMLH